MERVVATGLRRAGIVFIHNAPYPELDFYIPSMNLRIECKRASTPRVLEQMSRFPDVLVIQGLEAAHRFAEMINNGK